MQRGEQAPEGRGARPRGAPDRRPALLPGPRARRRDRGQPRGPLRIHDAPADRSQPAQRPAAARRSGRPAGARSAAGWEQMAASPELRAVPAPPQEPTGAPHEPARPDHGPDDRHRRPRGRSRTGRAPRISIWSAASCCGTCSPRSPKWRGTAAPAPSSSSCAPAPTARRRHCTTRAVHCAAAARQLQAAPGVVRAYERHTERRPAHGSPRLQGSNRA